MLQINHISKRFADVSVLTDATLSVADGRVCALLARNGGGKTTLMRILCGVFPPDGGDFSCSGTLSYLPEERGLPLEQTPCGFLAYIARLRGMSKKAAVGNALALLDEFRLAEFSHYRIGNLSKGMQQKVQFLSAVVAEPRVVLLDEPFSGVDATNAAIFKNRIRLLKNAGATVFVTAHEGGMLETFCDEFAVLNGGKIVFHGDRNDFRSRFRGERIFVVASKLPLRLPENVVFVKSETLGVRILTYIKSENHVAENELLASLMKENEILSFVQHEPAVSDFFDEVK